MMQAQEETARRELMNVQQQMNNAMQHHMQLGSVCGAHLAEGAAAAPSMIIHPLSQHDFGRTPSCHSI